MSQIYNINSDSENMEELISSIRKREINQKFIYFGDGAENYYKNKEKDLSYQKNSIINKDYYDFGLKNKIFNNEKNALISLGCGDSFIESKIIKNNKNEISYFGVDSSFSMLDLSVKNFKEIKSEKNFICADFSTQKFKQELEISIKGYKNKIFSFFSSTFGNIKHTDIIDILSNLLKKGDKIWLDVRIRNGLNIEDDLNISKIYSEDLYNNKAIKYFFSALKNYGANIEDFQLIMKVKKDEIIKSLIFSFYFLVKNKVILKIKGEKIILLPGEKIKIQTIYSYYPDGLINFFDKHGFKVIDNQKKGLRGQFLFEKK